MFFSLYSPTSQTLFLSLFSSFVDPNISRFPLISLFLSSLTLLVVLWVMVVLVVAVGLGGSTLVVGLGGSIMVVGDYGSMGLWLG